MCCRSSNKVLLLVVFVLILQSVLPGGASVVRAQDNAPAADDQSATPVPPEPLIDVYQPEEVAAPAIEPVAPAPVVALLPTGLYRAHLAPGASAAPFDGLPVELLPAASGSAEAEVAATLEVLPAELVGQLSPAGVAFRLSLAAAAVERTERMAPSAPPAGEVRLALDYAALGLPSYGGSFEGRLTLYRGVACTDDAAGGLVCRTFIPLPAENDVANGRLTVKLDRGDPAWLAALAADSPDALDQTSAAETESVTPGASAEAAAPDGESITDWLRADAQSGAAPLFVLAAAAASDQGTYAATPFDSSSEYQLSLMVGSMQTSYAVPLPPAAGGLDPEVTLQYDSGSVDGMTLNKNNQPGWAGIGWRYEPGSITRRLKTCGLTQAPGDLCLTGDNYVLQLNGVASPLVKDGSSLYHPQNDPRWKIQKLTNGATGHPDTHKEYWLVTTPDGTKYRFGGEFDPDKTAPNNDQNSAFFTPVYDQTCSSVSSYWVCNKAWKWNLDRIEDPNGNVVAFYYQIETNYYNARNGLFRKPYVRAGNVARIEYGRRTGSTTVPTQVKFNTADRCEAPCVWPANYPDTPGDLTCTSTGTCSQNKPTFWSRLRLDTIEPQYWDTGPGAWVTIAMYALSHQFVKPPNDPNGAKNEPKLWLDAITQKSADGASSLPSVQYGYVLKQNRRDNGSACTPTYCSGNSSLTMPRLNRITDPLGGLTDFVYDKSHECPIVSSGFVRFPYDCFVAWNPAASGFSIFNKWKIMSVTTSDAFSGNPAETVTYSYSTPITHYDDDPVTPSSQKSWGDYRGSAIVTETDASGAKTEHRFYRGMNGDYTSSGATYITLSDGTTRADENWLRGREVETRRMKADNSVLARSVTWFSSTLTAGSGNSGAYFVGVQKVEDTTYGTTTKTTRVENTYDSYGNSTRQVLHGDTSTTADDRNIERSYVYNTTAYIVDTAQWEKLWAGTVSGAAGQEKAYTAYAYDGLAIGATPTKGNVTRTRAYSQVTPAAVYVDTVTGYDTWGRPTTVTDPNNRTTTTAYHAFYGYPASVTNALNHMASTVRHPGWGVPLTVTDPNSRVVTLQYDAFGRLSKVWLPAEPTGGPASREFVYAPAARPAWIQTRQLQDAAASRYVESWAYFDGFGRGLQGQSPLLDGSCTLTSQSYDATGQPAYASAPYQAAGAAGSGYVPPTWTSLANYTYTTYDELDRPVRTETRSGASTLWTTRSTYDGWQTASYDENDHRQDSATDAFGQPVQVVEYNTGGATYTTNYGYDLAGRLTTVTDANNNTTTLGYDLLGRKTTMSDPDMGSWQYGYDPGGNLTSQRDGANRWVYLEYDALNRLIRKRQDTVSGPVLAEWLYDAAGQIGLPSKSLAYSAAGTTEVYTVAYDASNRPTQQQWTVPGGGVFRFDHVYNAAGQHVSLRYPGGNAGQQGELVTYGYNAIGQLTSLASDDGTQYISATAYNAQGQVTEQRLDTGANGFTRQWGYNANTLRLETLKAGTSAPYESLQNLTYTYDLAGNITGITDATNANQAQTFGYDWLDRLTSASTNAAGVGQYNHTYQYNAIGNLTSNNGNVYTYGSKPHAVAAAFGNTYDYDGNGNQTSRTVAGVSYTQTFDYDNRLTAVTGGAVSATFVYDAEGNRVRGTVAGVTTVYVSGVYEYVNGATTKYYDGGAFRRTDYATDNGVFYSLSDHLRSTSVLVNRNGTVNSHNYYYPYGGNRGGASFSMLTTKRFTGQYHEQGLPGGEGLSYYQARWYDAQVGMFISADTFVPSPLAPQTLNRYAYTSGNPLKYVDPSGHMQADPDNGYRTRSAPKPAPKPPVTWPSPFSFPVQKTYVPPYVGTPARTVVYLPIVRSAPAPRASPAATSVVRMPRPTATPTRTPYASNRGAQMRAGGTRAPTTTPTPTARPTRAPTPTPTVQPGRLNWRALIADFTWESGVEPALLQINGKTTIRALGRAVSPVPIIGVLTALGASVAPGVVENRAQNAPTRKLVLDALTDAIGVPVSMAGGALITGAGSALGLEPTDLALPFVGSAATSIAYDLWGAPLVNRELDMRFAALGW